MAESRRRTTMDFYRLDTILQQMIHPRSVKPTIYKRFSALLISEQKKNVIDYIMKTLVATFAAEADELEPVFDEPESVVSFFVNLCREYPWIICLELTDNDPKNRYQMALILRSVFTLHRDYPTINLCRELLTEQMTDIWHHFLRLFTDSEPEIRKVCVEIIDILLNTQIDERIVSNLLDNLKKRFRDINIEVRNNSALIVENCSESENILDRNLMRHFVARIGDHNEVLRTNVLISASKVFNTIRRKYRQTVEPYFYKISTACLILYTTKSLKVMEKALVEQMLTISLIEMSADSSTKMQNLLNLICFCDDKSVQSMAQIFHNQLIIRTLFAKLIISSERHSFKCSIIYSNKKVAQSLSQSFEYIDQIKELLDNFHHLLKNYSNEDNNRIRRLINVFVCKPSMSCHQSIDVIEELFGCEQSIVDSEAMNTMKDQIIIRSGIGLIDSNALIQLLGHMDEMDVKYAHRLASFVVLLSKCYSHYFTDERVVEELLGLHQIILSLITEDSMIDCLKFSPTLKERIKNMSKSMSQSISE